MLSALTAIVVGTIVGLIIGAIKHSMKRAILPAIVGCFFGTMLICILPIFSTPGIVGGGAYGGLVVISMAVFLLPLGAVGGAVAGGIMGLILSRKRQQQLGLVLLVVTYCFMPVVMYSRITSHCINFNQTPMYCSEVGFPH